MIQHHIHVQSWQLKLARQFSPNYIHVVQGLISLASNPGIVLTRTQIFEAVWNMDSDSCHSSVVNVIYNVRKKIKPDSKNPTYIKTVLGAGYKLDVKNAEE